MKRIFSNLSLWGLSILCALCLSACQEEDDELQEYAWLNRIVTVEWLGDGVDQPLLIEEGRSLELSWRITPSEMAPFLAAQPVGTLWMAPRVPTAATLDITEVTATTDGLLKLTLLPNGTEAGRTYDFALRISDGMQSLLTTVIRLYREPLPVETPQVNISQQEVSQTLAE